MLWSPEVIGTEPGREVALDVHPDPAWLERLCMAVEERGVGDTVVARHQPADSSPFGSVVCGTEHVKVRLLGAVHPEEVVPLNGFVVRLLLPQFRIGVQRLIAELDGFRRTVQLRLAGQMVDPDTFFRGG